MVFGKPRGPTQKFSPNVNQCKSLVPDNVVLWVSLQSQGCLIHPSSVGGLQGPIWKSSETTAFLNALYYSLLTGKQYPELLPSLPMGTSCP